MIAEAIPGWLQNYVDKINNLGTSWPYTLTNVSLHKTNPYNKLYPLIPGLFESKNANHILVNEYLPGAGIMPHSDGPLFYPTISTISCGSHTVLNFYNSTTSVPADEYMKAIAMGPPFAESNCGASSSDTELNRKIICKLLIEPRSLLILKHDMYAKYLHGISDALEDVVDEHIKNLENCCEPYKIGDRVERNIRISLTIRHVPKTSRLKFKTGA